jgi:hypothetical protein
MCQDRHVTVITSMTAIFRIIVTILLANWLGWQKFTWNCTRRALFWGQMHGSVQKKVGITAEPAEVLTYTGKKN